MITRNWRDTSYEYVSAWHLFSIVWYFNLCKKVAFLQSCYKPEINPCQLVLITLNIEKIDIWYCGLNHNLNLWAALRKLSSVHNNRRLQYSAEACKWTDTQLFLSQICLIKSWKTFICEFRCPDCMWPLGRDFTLHFVMVWIEILSYLRTKKLSTEKKALFTAWKENLWEMLNARAKSSAK